MNATRSEGSHGRVAKGLAAGVATVVAVGGLAVPAFGAAVQTGGVSNSGQARADTGGNTAVGNQSTNVATTSSVLGGLIPPLLTLGAPQNNSSGTANVTTGPATAAGNTGGGSVSQGSGAGSGGVQSGSVTNAGSAVASTGGNTAIGNQSTNTASVEQNVTGGLLGLAVNIGGPSNQSSGTAAINTGSATAHGNVADGAVVQGSGGSGRCGRAGTFQRAGVTNTGTASADTGGNQAVGNASTNTASVEQNVDGGLLGLNATIGGPTNTSTGSATVNTGPATAVGNQATGSVVQEDCVPSHRVAGRLSVSGKHPATVTGRSPLPRTGGDLLALGNVAALLMGLGLVAMRVGRDVKR